MHLSLNIYCDDDCALTECKLREMQELVKLGDSIELKSLAIKDTVEEHVYKLAKLIDP